MLGTLGAGGVVCAGGAVLVDVDWVGAGIDGCAPGCFALAHATASTETATSAVTGMASRAIRRRILPAREDI